MDHDSIAGTEEFLAAADAAKMGATIGIECRVKLTGSPFENKKLNNPDQAGVAYMTMHGVPHDKAAEVNAFFAPYRALRNERNKKMVAGINEMMGKYGKMEYCRLAAHGYKMLADAVKAKRAYDIDCPLLVLCGEKDAAASTKRYNRMWEKREGVNLVWVPGAGHNANVDNPAFVNAQIERFLDEIAAD
jgi:pimeloyl-ACP methyl ester carboxylesterase